MEKEKTHDLLKIGLTEGEAKVYLALIELGSSTVGPVVKKSGVAYSNVYDILQRLMHKGIASYIIKNKTKHFQAASPSALYDYLEKREREITKQKQSLEKLIPKLKELQKIKPQQQAEIFLGKRGLKSAYEKFSSDLDTEDETLYFYIHDKKYAKVADSFYLSIQDLMKKLNIRGIANKTARKSLFDQKVKFVKKRYVDFPIPGNMEVCKDKLLLISWEKPIIAVLIQSQTIAETFRKYFNSVWEVAKP